MSSVTLLVAMVMATPVIAVAMLPVKQYKMDFMKQELMELSIVPIPSNSSNRFFGLDGRPRLIIMMRDVGDTFRLVGAEIFGA